MDPAALGDLHAYLSGFATGSVITGAMCMLVWFKTRPKRGARGRFVKR